LPVLTQVLDTASDTNVINSARLNRAISYLQTGEFEAAKAEYELLRTAVTNSFQAYYGLGEIAYRQTNHAEAIRNYELYLSHAPAGTDEAQDVAARLKELKPGSP